MRVDPIRGRRSSVRIPSLRFPGRACALWLGWVVLAGCDGTEDTAGHEGDDTGGDDTAGDTGIECPGFERIEGPGPAAAEGSLQPLRLAVLGDVEGREIGLSDAGSKGSALAGPVRAVVGGGEVTFDGIAVAGTGLLRLSVDPGAGCPVVGPLAEVLVGTRVETEPTYLPTARSGAAYVEALPAEVSLSEPAPPGLEVSGGEVSGIPEAVGAFLFEAAAWGQEREVRRLLVHLPVLPGDDADLPAIEDEPSENGPFDVDSLTLTIPTIVTQAGTLHDVAVRVAYPTDGDGDAAEGVFGVVAFHHAAHSPSTIYDRYTDLHDRWASHGLVVASVDASGAIAGTYQSWDNLHDLSTVQLGLVDLLRRDPGPILEGHLDTDRIFVSGHSRGGAASLISLWRDPALGGAVCFEPVSPVQTPYQDWGDPDGNGDRPYPVRPILLLAGSRDADEPWPLVDTAWDQTVGPTLFATLMGANHEDTFDEDTPGTDTSASTIPVAARHDLDQHFSVAFLARFGAIGDPAGDLSMERLLFGPESLSSDLSAEGVAVHGRRYLASTLRIDDFQGDGAENLLGGTNAGSGLAIDTNEAPYDEGLAAAWRSADVIDVIGRWSVARHLAWSDPEAELRFELSPDGAPADLTERSTLALRVQRDCPPPGYGACPDEEADFEVVLGDASGCEVAVLVSEGMGVLGIIGRHWQDSLLPLDAFAPVDLARATTITFRFDAIGIAEGDLWVDDLRVE
ncbi:MAG: hypothetical protein JXB39_04900 [Deltaproteobacteria bacterium]|nr:hypothetical protein [Deltaproteobacteria bacterium]